MEDQIRVLKVEPGKEPEQTMMENTLEAMQSMVGGYIEMVSLDERTLLVCNEEGKLMGLEGNRRLGSDIIAGTFFVVGDDGCGNLCSLDAHQLNQYTQQFAEPQSFRPGEVEEKLGLFFVSM